MNEVLEGLLRILEIVNQAFPGMATLHFGGMGMPHYIKIKGSLQRTVDEFIRPKIEEAAAKHNIDTRIDFEHDDEEGEHCIVFLSDSLKAMSMFLSADEAPNIAPLEWAIVELRKELHPNVIVEA